MKVLFYTPSINNRILYGAKLIFRDVLKMEVELTQDKEYFLQSEVAKLSYAYRALADELNVIPHGLLDQTGIEEVPITVFKNDKYPLFFQNKDDLLGFDIFAGSFYLASRYEEYLPHVRDKHERFAATNSLAHNHGFLNLPVINLWCDDLLQQLMKKYPEKVKDLRKYSFNPTIDVDNAFAYLDKGMLRTVGAFGRSLLTGNFSDIKQRSRTILGLDKDKYDTFDRFIAIQRKYGIKQLFFFLVGDYGLNDKNVPIHSRRFQSLIKHVNDYCEVGLHPSFASIEQSDRIGMEKERLSQVVHESVTKSRQHFLIVHLPHTYRNLMDYDIQEDYSMGYPEKSGFRASICSPFQFYDLELEKESKLRLVPFSFMEATYKYYLPEAIQDFNSIVQHQVDVIRRVKGDFCVLWHSDSISESDEWKGWGKRYEEVVQMALSS